MLIMNMLIMKKLGRA